MKKYLPFIAITIVLFLLYIVVYKKFTAVTPDICIMNIDETHRLGVKYFPGIWDASAHQEAYTSTNKSDWVFIEAMNPLAQARKNLSISDLSVKDPRICEQVIQIMSQ